MTKKTKASKVKISKTSQKVVKNLQSEGRKVQVVGRLIDGKVVLDQESLQELAKKFPNAEMAFVAVNAPFDPLSPSTNTLQNQVA